MTFSGALKYYQNNSKRCPTHLCFYYSLGHIFHSLSLTDQRLIQPVGFCLSCATVSRVPEGNCSNTSHTNLSIYSTSFISFNSGPQALSPCVSTIHYWLLSDLFLVLLKHNTGKHMHSYGEHAGQTGTTNTHFQRFRLFSTSQKSQVSLFKMVKCQLIMFFSYFVSKSLNIPYFNSFTVHKGQMLWLFYTYCSHSLLKLTVRMTIILLPQNNSNLWYVK